jgi:hypothetical protein
MKSLTFLLVLASPTYAATSYLLPGNAEYGSWNLRNSNYNNSSSPAYPASGGTNSSTIAWGGPIAASASSATFTRFSGAAYFIGSGSGLYGTTNANTYVVEDLSPIPDLANLLFQARTNNPGIVMGSPGGGFASVLLYLNGGTTPIPATHLLSTAVPSSTNSDFGWQWDLSSYGTIDSYQIVIEANPHNLLYGNAADLTTISASDRFAQVIPEPSASLFGMAALGLTCILRRRA